MRIGCICLLIINMFSFAVTAWDKSAARRDRRRVPERTLMWLAALFGAAGTLLAMYTVRHKTRKPKFKFGVPCLLLAQIALLILLHRFV